MYREFYTALSSPLLPIVVMAFFVGSFALVLLRVLVVKGRRDYDDVAALPLDEPAAPDTESPSRSASREVSS